MAATLDREPSISAFLDGRPKRHLINGEWVASSSGATYETINPSTGESLAVLAECTVEDVDRAVAAARAAFEGRWSTFSPAERQNVLLRFADLVWDAYAELRVLDALDAGVPIGHDPTLGREFMVEVLRYYAGWATKLHGQAIRPALPNPCFAYTVKEPVGVVASIFPWNAPHSFALWKLAPALATGCTIVLKPAEEGSLSPLRMCELIQELDLPPGVVNILTGTGSTAGVALTEHPGVDKISFTGSTATGQAIVRASAGNLKRVTLELGGKSPDIVFADAKLDDAVLGTGMSIFWNAGQVCCAGSRTFVERAIYDEFVERLTILANTVKVGDSSHPDTVVGPLISHRQLDRVTGYLERGRAEGARTLAGGARLTDGALGNGYFVSPTVFVDVRDDMEIACEEIFGPVASILPFDTMDEVARRANLTEYGLRSGIWTSDIGKAHKLARLLRTGVVWVNTYGQFDPAVPFGGYKMSGLGHELGEASLDDYLNVKSVWINTE
jgi:aldehyde dehydrogenase (NAD+)